jgi:hypothetical protein
MKSFEEGRIESIARWCLGHLRWCLALAIMTSVLILIVMINFKQAFDWNILVVTGLLVLSFVPLGLGVAYEFHITMKKIFPTGDEEIGR